MAKITITIEDLNDGKVKVEATPNFEEMLKIDISGHKLTSAHGYAIHALNALRHASKNMDDKMIVKIPTLL